MNTLTRLVLAAALVAAPLAACTQQEADNAADTAGETAENAGAAVRDTAGDAADATRDAAGTVADETRETVDDATTTTEETSVRAGDDGLEVRNTETQR